MKKTLIYMAAVAAMAACTRPSAEAPRMIEWSFEAAVTKASIASDGAFSWDKGDEIVVWNSTSSAFVNFKTPAGSGKFTATAPSDAHFTDCALYPAAQVVSATSVSLPASYADAAGAGKAFPMYAKVEEGSKLLTFKNLGALLSVPMVYLPAESATLEISSSSSALSGNFAISGGEIPAISGSGSVRVPIPTGRLYFTAVIPIPTGSYPLTIKVLDSSDASIFELVGTEPISFERAKLYKLEQIEADTSSASLIAVTGVESLEPSDDSTNWE